MPPDSLSARPRLIFMDWLRIAAFGLLVLYHVGMIYVPWAFHVKHDPVYPALQPWMRLTNPWRMSLLFVISGVATAWMLGRPHLGRERSRRLLLPLLAGMLLIVPLQPYLEVRDRFGYAGSFRDFMGLYLTGHHGFCDAGACLRLPTWNHLWYLPYLWAYTMVALALWRWLPHAPLQRVADRLARAEGWRLLVVPWLVVWVIRLALVDRYPENHAFWGDLWSHAHHGWMFATGLLLGRRPGLMARLVPLRWWALGLALAAWAGLTLYLGAFAAPAVVPPELRLAMRAVYALQQVGALVAAFGFAQRWWTRDHPWRAPLTEAVFPLYLVHQTLIIGGFVALRPLGLPAGPEAALLVLLTVAGGLATWALGRRWQPLRPWLGMARTDRGA